MYHASTCPAAPSTAHPIQPGKLPRRILGRPSWAQPGRPWRVSMRSFVRYVAMMRKHRKIPVYEMVPALFNGVIGAFSWLTGRAPMHIVEVRPAQKRLVRFRRPTRREAVSFAVCEVLRKTA